ncbi:glycosyltransferase family 4 protein [Vagococcus carniphilus]|uniref:glycosyltransferase family 4 protein n=1 Tax=Vagococcus carniphilus TaxID=218144 RepID=UPI0028925197|nr:glycosyltransferase family 4 protein [Vagococcus carniphilus]MDT2830943.1 glycosyltransferase family 4 protein [Vagococcus carniphilus]MDT2838160.1 glycosyltransferase family 4 protein [Vagococcus carniphilus]MDT2853679.1 glycosyltransferase family 4 protein [Vagococcus carniphilus]
MKKKILVVSQYFYPEQFRINDICKEWVERGYEVTVLTGIPNYPQGKYYKNYGLFKNRKEFLGNIEIIRIPLVPRKKSSIFLALNYLSFMLSGYLWAAFTKRDFDEVFIYEVSPMTQAIPGIKYAKRKKIKSMIYVLDLWPENFIELSGIKNKQIASIITKMVKWIYSNVDRILISSPGFKERIKQLGDYAQKVTYWPQYAEDFYKPSKKDSSIIDLDINKINITFAGNIGYAQGLELLPLVAVELAKNKESKIHFNIIGNGRYKEDFIKEVLEKDLDSFFSFYSPVKAEEIPKIFKNTDVALVSLSKSPIFSLTIPAKVQSILATGTPLLVSADGIMEQIIIESKAGMWSKAGDVEGLVKNIQRLEKLNNSEFIKMKENALEYSQKEFSKETLLNIIDDFWEEK